MTSIPMGSALVDEFTGEIVGSAATEAAVGTEAAMFGGPEIAAILLAAKYGIPAISKLFDRKSTKEIQAERMNALLGRNVAGYKDFLTQTAREAPVAANVTAKYAADPEQYQGFDPESGVFINEKFGDSRKEGELTPYDIWGGTGLFETYGDEWLGKYSEKNRYDISQALLNEGLIREKKGGIYVNDQERAKELAKQVLEGKYDFGDTNTGYKTPEERGAGKITQSTGEAGVDAGRIPGSGGATSPSSFNIVFNTPSNTAQNKRALAGDMAYNIGMAGANKLNDPFNAVQNLFSSYGNKGTVSAFKPMAFTTRGWV